MSSTLDTLRDLVNTIHESKIDQRTQQLLECQNSQKTW